MDLKKRMRTNFPKYFVRVIKSQENPGMTAGVEYWMEPVEKYCFLWSGVPGAIWADGKYFFGKRQKKIFSGMPEQPFCQENLMIQCGYGLPA